MRKSRSVTVTTLSKWYHSITDLSLARFIDILVDGNLFALVIAGNPSKEQLEQTFEQIKIQYADAIKNPVYLKEVLLQRDILRISVIIEQARLLIEGLKDMYTKEFAKSLNRLLSSSMKLDPSNPEQYEKDLERARNCMKSLKIDQDLKIIELDTIRKNGKGEPQEYTREYFQDIIMELEDFAKKDIDPEKISTYMFCSRVNRLNQYCKQLKRQMDGKRGTDKQLHRS